MAFSQNLTPKEFDSLLVDVLSSSDSKNRQSIEWNEQMLKKAKKQNYPKGMIWAHINIANQYFANGKLDESIKRLNAAKKISSVHTIDNYTLGRIEEQYSFVYYGMHLFDQSLANNDKAIQFGKKTYDKTVQNAFLFRLYANRANYFYHKNQPDSAIINLRKSLKYEQTPYALSSIASHFIDMEPNMDSARIYLNRAYKAIETTVVTSKEDEYAIVYLYYGQLYLKNEKYDSAVYYFEKSVSYAEEKKNYMTLLTDYEMLAKSYKALNNTEKENEYMTKLLDLRKDLEQAQAKGVELTLNKFQQDKAKESERLRKRFWLYGGVGLSVGLIVFVYLYFENRRKKNRIEEKSAIIDQNKDIIIRQKQVIIQKEDETEDLKRKLSMAHEEIIELAKNNDIGFLARFQEVYPELSDELLKINPQLTQSDLSFCALIWLGFSSKDIANYTFMQHRSVQSKKNRLRKKLEIDSEIDLYFFFRSIVKG